MGKLYVKTLLRPTTLIKNTVLYGLLLIAGFSVILPFLWMVSASFKTSQDVFSQDFTWIPKVFRLQNYIDIWQRIPLALFFLNTAKLTLIITLLQLFTSSFAAYAFAKLEFRGRNVLFLAYVATIAIPWQVYMLPQFIMMRKLGLTDTHMSLILLQAFTPFGVFLMRQFFLSIPKELIEAARLDGLSEWGIYARIMLPLAKPALATLTIFTFIAVWNDYMGPMIYLTTDKLKTIQIGLRMFLGQYSADYNLIMAAALCSLVPVFILFLAVQRYFIEGIASSGLKG